MRAVGVALTPSDRAYVSVLIAHGAHVWACSSVCCVCTVALDGASQQLSPSSIWSPGGWLRWGWACSPVCDGVDGTPQKMCRGSNQHEVPECVDLFEKGPVQMY